MTSTLRLALTAIAVASLPLTVLSQTPPPTGTLGPKVTKPQPPTAPKPGELKKYADVITKEAQTQDGVFKIHRIDEHIYWEIPTALYGRLFLWQTEISQLPAELGYPGTAVGTRAIRFTRRGNKLYFRNAETSVRSVAQGAVETGVEANTIEPIIASYDILTEGENKSAVIDVTNLFTTDPQDFAVKGMIGAGGVDPSRSYIDRVKAFPTNIETRSQLTFFLGGAGRFGFLGGGGLDASTATVVVHYSLDLLPDKPMMGRLKDSRIGYFTTDFTEYGRPENRSVQTRLINRFRLEKKDPNAAVSDPVKPITFYLSREVPEKWRPFLKLAIEDWQKAFDAAGISHAIVAKDAPSVAEDPNWDAEDARYSVIRWAPSTTENAQGPSIQDPRSGETLSAHVIVWNDVVKLAQDWYFAQCGAIDPRARQIPMSDAMTGNMLRYIISHEVGHTLGLEHNFKGSTAYTIAQLRDPAFTTAHGVAASIMSYSRTNYVAQPGDGVTRTWGMIGPYDIFAIKYGYMSVPAAGNPDAEKPALDRLLSEQVTNPWLRFGNYLYYGTDPTTQMENISNDPVEAGRLGLLNLDRIAKSYLVPSTTKFGDDYTKLAEMQSQLLSQRITELLHIVPMVGGVVETDYHSGRGGEVFAPVSKQRQEAAVKFLTTRGFETPVALYDPKIVELIRPTGQVDGATGVSTLLISVLLNEARLHRIQDSESQLGGNSFTVTELFSDITNGVWSELDSPTPGVDIYRRNLQRAYLKTVDSRINGASASRTDLKAIARDQLRGLAGRIDKALPKVKDKTSFEHLTQSRHDIEQILQGRFSVAAGSSFSAFDLFGISSKVGLDDCWSPGGTLREAVKEATQ